MLAAGEERKDSFFFFFLLQTLSLCKLIAPLPYFSSPTLNALSYHEGTSRLLPDVPKK